MHAKNRALLDPETNYRFGAKLDGLAKGALVAVSKTNGHRARVVLLVEDDFFVRCGVADELREAGYTVVETPSGEEAIALCKSDITIDMVFTDINLTGAASG